MKFKTRDLTYIAAFVALAVVFDLVSKFIPFLQMPNGGSIELSVVAVICASFLLGWKKGVLVAFLAWIVGFMFSTPYIISFPQMMLDYIVPVGILGFAALIPATFNGKRFALPGTFVVCALRTISFVLSGVYFWPPEDAVAGSSPAWVYSLSYNLPYSLATMLVALILVPIIINRLAVNFELN
ncbi:MAG: energy-coupled thiamine transporter ThiT [Erysipelotrichaceae bacterium]